MPPVGTNNILSTPEIRWCIASDIAIETLRELIDTDKGVREFNKRVQDHKSRCGSYRYREGSLEQAKREVEPYRKQIVTKVTQDALQTGLYQATPPSASLPSTSSNAASLTATPQEIEEAQQLLTKLGYNPGPVDRQYGRRTADAVKAFQKRIGMSQDGQIDQGLLSTLRRMGAARASSLPSAPSFDCTKATTPVERAICADPLLVQLDRVMADTYTQVLNVVNRQVLREEQRRWIELRDKQCANTPNINQCIQQHYKTRLQQLANKGGAEPLRDAPSHQPYLFELLKRPVFLKSWQAMFAGEKDVPYWLSPEPNGLSTPGEKITLGGQHYITGNACQAHLCGNNNFYVLFTENGERAWGLLLDDDHPKGRFFNQPDSEKQKALRAGSLR
jgi:uncharacterized protein YecT (DUF1311 family)